MRKAVLTLPEIILNFRKLKNRVAAQTSRDRKKARLDDLEVEVKAVRQKVCVIHVCFYNFLFHSCSTKFIDNNAHCTREK